MIAGADLQSQLANIMNELGFHSGAQVVAWAVACGLTRST